MALDFHLLLGANQRITMSTLTFVLSLGSPALAMEVPGSLPMIGRAQVVQEPLGFITTPGVHAPPSKIAQKGPGRGCGWGE